MRQWARKEGGRQVLFFLPTLTLGGAERQTVQLRELLMGRGYETSLIVYGRPWSSEMAETRGAEGALHFSLRGMSDPIGWVKMWRALRRVNADVIIAVNQTPLIVAVALRCLGATRARVACVFHTTYLLKKERPRFFVFRWALRIADAFVCVSAKQRRMWLERGVRARRVTIIPNGVDLNVFRPNPQARSRTRSALRLRDTDLLIGLIATFRPEKNHKLLLRALSVLHDEGVAVHALLVGSGPTMAETLRLAGELGLASRVTFVGAQSDVRPWIAACDVGVLCSRAETFPLSALEFLAMGVPMILPDLGGASEIVDDGVNGYVFKSDSIEGLVSAIRRLGDGAERARLAAAACLSERFSDERMADGYEELIEELLRRKTPGRPTEPLGLR